MHRLTARFASAVLSLLAFSAPHALAQCQPQWLPGFGDAGLPITGAGNDWNYAITSWDPDGPGPSPSRLIAASLGVTFSSPQVPQARAAGYWDGRAWMPLAMSSGAPNAMVAFDGQLIMGGGQNWVAPGGGAGTTVAAFDGNAFTALGSPLFAQTLFSLTVWNGQLVAGAGNSNGSVAIRSGGAWTNLPAIPSTSSGVWAMAAHNGELYCGGSGSFPFRVHHWDGDAWQSIPYPTLGGGAIKGMASWNGLLIAGTVAADFGEPAVVAWDGAAWSSVGQGIGNVGDLCVHDGELYALGDGGNGLGPYRIYRFDGAAWQPLRPWQGTPMGAIASHNGAAITAGQPPSSSTLTSVIRAVTPDSVVQLTPTLNSLTVMNCPAGLFASSNSPQGIFQRTGDTWTPVGTFSGSARTLGYFNGQLLAAGAAVSRWDGASWSNLGASTPWACSGCSSSPLISALQEYDSALYAAGVFTHANGAIASGLARWNGSVWQSVSGSLQGSGRALAVHDGALYVGGLFSIAGTTQVANIARCNGATWSAVSGGLHGGGVYALESHDGHLYAGGTFTNVESPTGPAAPGLARFDGSSWTPVLGLARPRTTAPRTSVYALRSIGGILHIGGDFRYAGDHVSTGLAMLRTSCPCPADFNGDGLIFPDDLSEFITCFFLQVQFPGFCPLADFNGDGLVFPDDLSEFITTFFLAIPSDC